MRVYYGLGEIISSLSMYLERTTIHERTRRITDLEEYVARIKKPKATMLDYHIEALQIIGESEIELLKEFGVWYIGKSEQIKQNLGTLVEKYELWNIQIKK